MARLALFASACIALIGLLFVVAGPQRAAATPRRPTPEPTTAPTLAPTRVAPTVAATLAPPTAVPPTASPTLVPAPTSVPQPTPTAEPLDPPELRAVWVDAFHDGFKTPAQVDDLVAWARAANLNALFVQVRRRGDAYYLNSIEPRSEDPDLAPGFDALQYLIDKAHQGPRRLQVHAWLATLPIWSNRDTPPAAPNHAFNLRGLSADPADTWLMYRDDGQAWAGVGSAGIYYLDPGNPDVQSYTTEIYLQLLRNYDVDGIHLDQIRYYEGDALRWGYNPTSVGLFNAAFGREPTSQPAPADPDWVAWRRDQVTNLVRRIYTDAKAIKPTVAVTAAVVTWGKGPQTAADWETQAAYAAVLQDWRAWLQQGIVDYLLPMDYYREAGQQAAWFDTWTKWQANVAGRRNIVLGLGSYLNSADGVMAQLDRARALGALGVALYSYAVPTADLENAGVDDRLAYAERLRTVFARPAPVPALSSSLVAAP
jgi:uncharacterized lipoprotein YddW (UPF0748 family)